MLEARCFAGAGSVLSLLFGVPARRHDVPEGDRSMVAHLVVRGRDGSSLVKHQLPAVVGLTPEGAPPRTSSGSIGFIGQVDEAGFDFPSNEVGAHDVLAVRLGDKRRDDLGPRP